MFQVTAAFCAGLNDEGGTGPVKDKKNASTAEERLKEALVPKEEQPYELPGNWAWVRLGSVIELISGRDAALIDCNNMAVGIPYILGASNIENNTFLVERWIENPQVVSRKGDILLSVKGTIGKIYIQQENFINISRQIMAIRLFKQLNSLYVYYFFKYICDELREAGNGLIPGISRKEILEKKIPFSPLAEQKRIVERIEGLFSKLDEAKELIQSSLERSQLRRSAILHAAFTGQLTEQWRKENGVDMGSWRIKKLSDCGTWLGGGTPSKSVLEYWIGGTIPWVSPKDMKSKEIVDTIDHITEKALQNSTVNLVKEPALLFVMRSGILRRTLPLALVKMSVTVNQDLRAIIPDKKEVALVYLYWVCSRYEQDIRAKCSKNGTTVESINSDALFQYTIPLPSLPEQHEIVRILDSLLQKEDAARELCEGVLEKIELTRKSILAQAFRGHLGTNNPNDPSALDLLEKVFRDSSTV